MKTPQWLIVLAMLTGCSMEMSEAAYRARAIEMMKVDFRERGQAKLDRLSQDQAQALCSRSPADGALAKADAERIEQANLAMVKYPADGKFLGDWRAGERIAQSGVGKQFSDDPSQPAGANCYACHQLSQQELSFGTIGPSLLAYGKLRGYSEAIQRYTYGRVYNSQAYTACSNMPRFGHNGILTEQQIKDLVALLLDPQSPLNK
jgi:L-cysteine S-thiosulfotransferase